MNTYLLINMYLERGSAFWIICIVGLLGIAIFECMYYKFIIKCNTDCPYCASTCSLFSCPTGQTCQPPYPTCVVGNDASVCTPVCPTGKSCLTSTCPAGQSCLPPSCPANQICSIGTCPETQSCSLGTCPSGQVCRQPCANCTSCPGTSTICVGAPSILPALSGQTCSLITVYDPLFTGVYGSNTAEKVLTVSGLWNPNIATANNYYYLLFTFSQQVKIKTINLLLPSSSQGGDANHIFTHSVSSIDIYPDTVFTSSTVGFGTSLQTFPCDVTGGSNGVVQTLTLSSPLTINQTLGMRLKGATAGQPILIQRISFGT